MTPLGESPPDSGAGGSRRWAPAGLAVLVVAVTVASFLPALRGGFVNWGDGPNVLGNPDYRGLGWAQIRWMFATAYLGHYIPLAWLTLGLDYTVWGMNPAGYHATSVLLHAVNALLCYLVARRLLGLAFQARGSHVDVGAAVAALLFSLHPLRVEAVAWVTGRRDLVMGLFALLVVLAYLEAVQRGDGGRLHVGWHWAAVGLFGLTLLSGFLPVGLPLVLFALDFYPLRRLRGGPGVAGRVLRLALDEKIAFYGVAAAVGAITIAVWSGSGLTIGLGSLDMLQRLALVGYGVSFYLWKVLLPWPLSPMYALASPVIASSPVYLVSGGIVLAISIALILGARRWPAGLVAWVAYVALLLPASGILQAGAYVVADRYSYLACLPLALLGGAAVAWCREVTAAGKIAPRIGALAQIATAAILIMLAGQTVRQVGVWRDSVTLWRHAAAVDLSSDLPVFYLGWALADAGRFEEARDHFERSLARVPDRLPRLRALVLLHLGIVEQRAGNQAAAGRRFLEVLTVDPGHPAALIRLGVVLHAQGRVEAARAAWARAAGQLPGSREYEIRELQAAIDTVPVTQREARGQLAFALAGLLQQSGDLVEAEAQYRIATDLLPGHAVAWNDLGVVYARRGRSQDALAAFVQALRIRPGDRVACDNAQRMAAPLGAAPPELRACPTGTR
jgi:tetratricopeptide (TPR) repeat protein